MVMLEKLEECPDCGERKFWFYDGQMCANCGYGEPASRPVTDDFSPDRLEAWLIELWQARSIDLHMCDGTLKEDQFGLLRNIRTDVMALRRRASVAVELAASLKEISDMFMARPDMVKAIQPLRGFAEDAVFGRAAAVLAKVKDEHP